MPLSTRTQITDGIASVCLTPNSLRQLLGIRQPGAAVCAEMSRLTAFCHSLTCYQLAQHLALGAGIRMALIVNIRLATS